MKPIRLQLSRKKGARLVSHRSCRLSQGKAEAYWAAIANLALAIPSLEEAMIANEEQFAFVKTQVAHLEAALESLAKTVLPKSEKQFRIIAEGYVDQLAVLRADIDAYLGVWTVKNSGCPLHDPNPPSDKTKTTKRTK